MPLRRLRWLPRFSLSNLLMLMVVVGLCLMSYGQRQQLREKGDEIADLRLQVKRLTVNNILRSDLPHEQQVQELAGFIKLGDGVEDLELWCGSRREAAALEVGQTMRVPVMRFEHCDLVVQCRADGTIRSFGHCEHRQVFDYFDDVYFPLADADNPAAVAGKHPPPPPPADR